MGQRIPINTTVLKLAIMSKQQQYREEMCAENNKSSAVRSYARADELNAEIRVLESELQRIQSIQRQLRA